MSTEPDYSLLTQKEIDAVQAEPSPDELITMRQAEDAALLPDDADESVDSGGDDAAVDSASDSTLPAGLDKPKVAKLEKLIEMIEGYDLDLFKPFTEREIFRIWR